MPIDTEGLKDEIRRLSMILELANDPKSREALEKFVKPNGNGHKPNAPKRPANPEVSEVSLALSSTPASDSKASRYGLMAKLAYEALSSTPQSPEQIANVMIANGFQFAKGEPKYLVGDALRSLEAKGKAKRLPERGPYGAIQWIKVI
jgi:hypothetical protein